MAATHQTELPLRGSITGAIAFRNSKKSAASSNPLSTTPTNWVLLSDSKTARIDSA
jgi:hypothetical protein